MEKKEEEQEIGDQQVVSIEEKVEKTRKDTSNADPGRNQVDDQVEETEETYEVQETEHVDSSETQPGSVVDTKDRELTLEVSAQDDTSDISVSSRKIARKKGWKTRKRGRQARLAAIDESNSRRADESWHVHELPSNQYEIELRRRAIRKGEPDATKLVGAPRSPSRLSPGRRSLFKGLGSSFAVDEFTGYDEEYGDVSLGMKLNIVGGKVIVQNVTALADGRASPAQLTGMIKRGDVLLCIEDVSIVNLPIDQLVEGLKPLSSPKEGGDYRRTLKLRFAIGEGIELLEKSEKQAAKGDNDGATDMFSLTQFIHQSVPSAANTVASNSSVSSAQVASVVVKTVEDRIEPPTQIFTTKKSVVQARPDLNDLSNSVDKVISIGVANRLRTEHDRFKSEYFAWDKTKSELLRPEEVVYVRPDLDDDALTVLKEMVQTGTLAMKGARFLSINVENIDKGKDLRSFQAWNANLSVRSRASTRRRYFSDTTSVASSKLTNAVSVTSEASDEDVEEGLDGDEVLVRLAAHDEIWRKQVLGDLQETIDEMEREEKGVTGAPAQTQSSPSGDAVMSDTLGNLFLGDRLHQKIKKKKRPFALPPAEVTSVLFDLISHLAIMTPDEISLRGGFGLNAEMALVPFQHLKGSQGTEDKVLATHFILNNVYPAWLQSFKPLTWQQRKLLWSVAGANSNDTIAGGTYAVSDDGLTLDSGDTKASMSTKGKKKSLQEMIEEMELDADSKVETCFLVTFYFARELLPRIRDARESEPTKIVKEKESDVLSFVDKYGAYLKLPICLAYASFLESDKLVKKLLELAKHDIHHRRVMKELAKRTFMLYDTTMLSAVIARLQSIMNEANKDERKRITGFCVTAYPDVRPWQVRDATHRPDNAEQDLYYDYLSRLLHPEEGDDRARLDTELVMEWCKLSLEHGTRHDNYKNVWVENFLRVASRKQRECLLYKRDLVFLMEQSLRLTRRDLFLDLVDEIIDQPSFSMKDAGSQHVINTLRRVVREELERQSSSGSFNSRFLQAVFKLFEKIAAVTPESVQAAEEMHSLLCFVEQLPKAVEDQLPTKFIESLVSEVSPMNALDTILLWTEKSTPTADDVIPSLRQVLLKGAREGVQQELSSCLFRINHARLEDGREGGFTSRASSQIKGNIWQRLCDGDITINHK